MDKIIKKDGFSYAFNPASCNECNAKCCSGESGYIWLNENEIKEIANYLDIKIEQFVRDFLKKVKYKYSIKEVFVNNSYDCIFLNSDNGRCKIYDVRPAQCRTFPFWDYYKKRVNELQEECIGVIC